MRVVSVQPGVCRPVVRAGSIANPRHARLAAARYPATRVHAEPDKTPVAASDEAPSTSSEPEPIWVQREKARERAQQSGDLPFGVYLLGSVIVAIAAVGSMFEFANKNAIFGVVQPDSFLWAPILGLFALTGIPTSGYLFYKAVSAANKMSEEMDQLDGYK